jgi:hypothetical protein
VALLLKFVSGFAGVYLKSRPDDTGTAFLALSLIDEGYEVFANTDASGTFDVRLAEDANRRMEKAGVTLMGLFGIVCDLMRDWRNTPGLDQLLPFLDK